MKNQKLNLTFKNGSVFIDINKINKEYWINYIKCSKKHKSLGKDTLIYLNSRGFKPLNADKAIFKTINFWLKMQEIGLIKKVTYCHCLRCKIDKSVFSLIQLIKKISKQNKET